MVFDEHTLETEGQLRFTDEYLKGTVKTAHPQYFRDGTFCNLTQYFGKEHGYLVYTIPPGAKTALDRAMSNLNLFHKVQNM